MSETSGAEPTQRSWGKASGPRAGFWRRFAAWFLDALIVFVVELILRLALHGVGSVLSIFVSAGYFTYFEGGSHGAGFGKRALGIRVIDAQTGGAIGYARAFMRWISQILSALVVFIGYLWMLWDSEKQCWHDKLAGDVVVRTTDYPTGSRR